MKVAYFDKELGIRGMGDFAETMSMLCDTAGTRSCTYFMSSAGVKQFGMIVPFTGDTSSRGYIMSLNLSEMPKDVENELRTIMLLA